MNEPFKSFILRNAKSEEIYKILINIDSNKAYGIDEILGKFLKDGAELLTERLHKINNLSLSSKILLMCKTGKMKSIINVKILSLKTVDLFHYCQCYLKL